MNHYPTCMTLAGSDPSGGAGLQADLKTFTLLGCYGQAVPTALTVQNTVGVVRSVPLDGELIYDQAATVMTDWLPDAVKIGILPHAAAVRAVARLLREFGPRFVVLDPVLVSSSGHRLIDDEGIEAMQDELMPLCSLLTPNLPEATLLTGATPGTAATKLGNALRRRYPHTAILVKGGHAEGEPLDTLFATDDSLTALHGQRIATRNTHGTGCVLSSAIAAFTSRGLSLGEAVARAKQFIAEALTRGATYEAGHGHGPMFLVADNAAR